MSIVFNEGADVKSDPASNETKRYSLSSNYFGISLIFSSVGKEYLTTYWFFVNQLKKNFDWS